jgi:bla regulator protein BlaR1
MILMLSLATKATLVLVAVMVASWALRGSSASTRHALWALALSSLLALPVLSATLPRLGLPLLPLAEPEPSHALRLSPLESGRGAFDAASEAPPVRRWWDRALLVWLAGVSLGLIQLAASIVFASIVVRRARRVTSPEWSALLRETAAVMGVGRRVGLRVSGAVGVPIVWGYRSPVVLLAPEAMDWSPSTGLTRWSGGRSPRCAERASAPATTASCTLACRPRRTRDTCSTPRAISSVRRDASSPRPPAPNGLA